MTFRILPARLGGRVDTLEPLTHNETNEATGGIWRVRGPSGSAVVKVARPPTGSEVVSSWPTSDEPTHWNYWRREVEAYTSGFAATVYADAGIVAPDLLDVGHRPDGSVELWLADASGAPGMSWPVARIAAFARQLGAAQARWVGRVPALSWLSRAWLAQYLVDGPARRVGTVDWEHPLATVWPAEVRAGLRRLWARRHAVRGVAEATPCTVCHLDVWPTNLIDAGAATVLVDWSFTGAGGIGEDAANLIVDSVADGMMDAALLPEIAAAVLDSYVVGLRDGGWRGAVDDARRAIMAAGAAKYCWFGPLALGRVIRDGTFGHPQYGQDASGEAALHRLRGLVTMLAEWGRTVVGSSPPRRRPSPGR